MKKIIYLTVGMLSLCIMVFGGKKTVGFSGNQGISGKIVSKACYGKKHDIYEKGEKLTYASDVGARYTASVEKDTSKSLLEDIGNDYSIINVDREEYKIRKRNYTFIKEKHGKNQHQYRVEDLKGNVILSIEDAVWDVLLGEKYLYFIADGERYCGVVKFNIKNRKATQVPDTDDVARFGAFLEEDKIKYFYKDWLYLGLMEGDSNPGICRMNMKTGKIMYAPEYMIKGKTLYYGVWEGKKYDFIKLYKSDLNFNNSKYIGKYKKDWDWSKGQLLSICKIDSNYVYYRVFKHDGKTDKEATVKFKIKK